MPRVSRTDKKGYTYHVLNRANAKVRIFDDSKDYKMFEDILEEAKKRFDINLYAYCIMPTHWHMVLSTNENGGMQKGLGWITNTHTRRWHARKNTTGQGHLYQGRYKSFICQNDNHFLILTRYVERNPKKANLVKKAENWRWSSLWRKKYGTKKQQGLLSDWLIPKPKNYLSWINQPQTKKEMEAIELSLQRGSPFGNNDWKDKIVKKFKLESTLRSTGRPKKR